MVFLEVKPSVLVGNTSVSQPLVLLVIWFVESDHPPTVREHWAEESCWVGNQRWAWNASASWNSRCDISYPTQNETFGIMYIYIYNYVYIYIIMCIYICILYFWCARNSFCRPQLCNISPSCRRSCLSSKYIWYWNHWYFVKQKIIILIYNYSDSNPNDSALKHWSNDFCSLSKRP